MSPIWISIEALYSETRVMMSEPHKGPSLRARLRPMPAEPRAVAMLLEALSAWYAQPICAVFDADAEDAMANPLKWARLFGELDPERVRVECKGQTSPRRDRFLGEVGDFTRAQGLINVCATGLR